MRTFWVVLLLLVPSASAAPATLYMHFGAYSDGVMNLEAPPDVTPEIVPVGGLANSACIAMPDGTTSFTDQAHHDWYVWFADHRVVYEDGRPGQGAGVWQTLFQDVTFEAGDHTVTWYVSLDSADGAPMVLPGVKAEAWLETQDIGVSPGEPPVVYGTGMIGPVTLSPAVDAPGVSHHSAGGHHVYGFHVPLDLDGVTVPADTFMRVHMRLSLDEEVCDHGYLMPDAVSMYSDVDLRPTFQTAVADPLQILPVEMGFDNETLHVLVRAFSVFGSYAVSDGPWLMDAGTDGLAAELVANWTCSLCHTDSIERAAAAQEYVIDVPASDEGTYELEWAAQGMAGTGNATRTVTIQVGAERTSACDGDACLQHLPQNVASPPAAVGLVVVALAAAAARRRA